MLKYCRSDVDILRRGCMKFREMMQEVTGGIDPFDYVTIASVCMGIFKTLFLREETEREVRDIETETSSWCAVKYENNIELVNYNNVWIPIDELSDRENLRIKESRFCRSPVAAVPSSGYVPKDNYSKMSIQWLEWVMEESKRSGTVLEITHALNGGEHRIPGTNYRCDGYDKVNNTIYEFYGKC